MPIASAGSSSAPKDSQMARYFHIVPKPPPPNLGVHHHQYPMHGQLSPAGLQVSVSPNGNSSNHPLHHHHPHLFGLGNGIDLNRPHQSCVQDFSMQSNSNMRQITPPLTINVGSPIHQEVSAQVTSNSSNGLHSTVFGPHSPPAPNALLNLSPGLNPALEQHRTSPLGSYELPHRRSLQEIHSNVAGPVQQHSPLFYSGMYEDSGRKSESPTRKRRRTSMSSHSVIDLTNPNSPPSPSRPWDLIMLGDRAGLNINHHQRRRSTTPRRGTPIAEPSNTSRHRRSPTMRRVRYRDRQSPERRAFQPPPPMPTHHPLSSHIGFHPAMMPHHGQHGPLGPNHQMPPTASQPVVINVDQVSIPVAISPHNIPLYTSPHPIPICTSAHVPPCGMQAMHNCGQMQFSSCQMPHLGSCGNLHLSHHHHMYPPVIHPHSHQPTPSIPGQHHLLPPQFVQQPQMLPQVHDGDLHPQDMLNDHRTPGFPRLQPSQAAAMHPGPSLAHTPPLHVVQEQNVRNGQPDLHFPTLCSYVPHPRRASTNRRTASRRWRTPLPTSPAALPGFLLHVFAMFSNPSLPAYGPELVNQENAEAENYEALLNLAERLGEAKPRGLLKSEIDQLPSYRFNAETHQSEQTCCVVCMCDFEQRQLLRVLPCNHEFHAKCVDKWLKTNRTCPICRGDASEYFNHNE